MYRTLFYVAQILGLHCLTVFVRRSYKANLDFKVLWRDIGRTTRKNEVAVNYRRASVSDKRKAHFYEGIYLFDFNVKIFIKLGQLISCVLF